MTLARLIVLRSASSGSNTIAILSGDVRTSKRLVLRTFTRELKMVKGDAAHTSPFTLFPCFSPRTTYPLQHRTVGVRPGKSR